MKAYAHTNYVINSIKSTLLDLVLKLQEVDETIDPIQTASIEFQLEDLISGNISNDLLLRVSKKILKLIENVIGEILGTGRQTAQRIDF